MEIFLTILSIILLLIPIIDWSASIILHRATTRADHDNIALRERSRIAIILAIVTSINATLGANRLFALHFDNTLVVIELGISLILVSVPNIYWMYLYYSNKLRK